ncbi:MAG: PEP-CTERM sorting domain-containing protein, partial [Armatimonadota bacterium]
SGAAYADFSYFYGVAGDDFLDDNDTLWAALEPFPNWSSTGAVLRDNWNANDGVRDGSRDSVYDDLLWYADNLAAGDTFLFSYSGHGDTIGHDRSPMDEGSIGKPQTNDPAPDTSPPYLGDEFFGYSGGSSMWDDELTDALQGFDSGVEVIVLSGACNSGGWVAGSHDIDTSTPATNNGLYAVLCAPEHAKGIGLKEEGEDYYELLLTDALASTLEADMTMSDWYEAAMAYGESAYYVRQREWDSSPQVYYYWPAADWVPTEHDKTYYTDHWGWEETYWQLRPEVFSSLDAAHDHVVATPEPATMLLMIVGVGAICARVRRRGGR